MPRCFDHVATHRFSPDASSAAKTTPGPLQPRYHPRRLMPRDGPGHGNGPRAGSGGGRHGSRAPGGPDGTPGAARKPARGQRTGSLPQQAPVYGAVPPPPSLHSNGVSPPRLEPLGGRQVQQGTRFGHHQRASLHSAVARPRSAPDASVSPGTAQFSGAASFAKPGLGSSRHSNSGSDAQRQSPGLAPASRVFVRSSSSTGNGVGAKGVNWAGSGGSGLFGQGACRMAYEADKEPGIWKVPTGWCSIGARCI